MNFKPNDSRFRVNQDFASARQWSYEQILEEYILFAPENFHSNYSIFLRALGEQDVGHPDHVVIFHLANYMQKQVRELMDHARVFLHFNSKLPAERQVRAILRSLKQVAEDLEDRAKSAELGIEDEPLGVGCDLPHTYSSAFWDGL